MRILAFAPLLLALALRGAELQPAPSSRSTEHWERTGHGDWPAPSRIEELFNSVSAYVVVQKLAAQWDAGEVHATFTALEIRHGRTDRMERGLRIEMTRPGVKETVYVDSTVFPALRGVMAYYTAYLPTAADCSATNPDGGRLSWLFDTPRNVVHLLNTGVYFDRALGSPGFFLGRGFKTPASKGDFRFPKMLPKDFEAMLDAAEASFGRP